MTQMNRVTTEVSFSHNHFLSFVKCIVFCLVPDCHTSFPLLICFECICVLCIFVVCWSPMHLEADNRKTCKLFQDWTQPYQVFYILSWVLSSLISLTSSRSLICFLFVLSCHVSGQLMFYCCSHLFVAFTAPSSLTDEGHWSRRNLLVVNSGKEGWIDGW